MNKGVLRIYSRAGVMRIEYGDFEPVDTTVPLSEMAGVRMSCVAPLQLSTFVGKRDFLLPKTSRGLYATSLLQRSGLGVSNRRERRHGFWLVGVLASPPRGTISLPGTVPPCGRGL